MEVVVALAVVGAAFVLVEAPFVGCLLLAAIALMCGFPWAAGTLALLGLLGAL